MITEGRRSYFEPAQSGRKRSEHYAAIKQRYQQVFLNALVRHFGPELLDKVSFVDVGTPLTNETYYGRTASYGLDHTTERFLDETLRIATPVQGLYLTGQDVLCVGVFPQPIAAWMTLAKVVGVTSPDFWFLLGEFACSVGWRVCTDRTHAL